MVGAFVICRPSATCGGRSDWVKSGGCSCSTGSVAENIAYGALGPTPRAGYGAPSWAAAQRASIDALP